MCWTGTLLLLLFCLSERQQNKLVLLLYSPVIKPESLLNSNAFVAGTVGLELKSRNRQIGLSVVNGSPMLQHFFECSCIARVQ